MRSLLLRIAGEQGIASYPDLPEGVQVAERTSDSGTYLFVMNLCRESRELRMDGTYERLLAEETLDSPTLRLEPYGVEILKQR